MTQSRVPQGVTRRIGLASPLVLCSLLLIHEQAAAGSSLMWRFGNVAREYGCLSSMNGSKLFSINRPYPRVKSSRGRTLAAEEHCQRHCGVVVCSRNMPAGKDHHHQRRTNGQRSEIARATRFEHRETDRGHEEKSSNELH